MLHVGLSSGFEETHTKLCRNIEFLVCKVMSWNMPRRHRGVERLEIQLYSFFKLGASGRWVVNATPHSIYPQKSTRYPF